MRLNGDDDRPVRPLFDVGNHDLSVPQGNGRRTHDSARSVGADFLDDQVARGTRDRQEGRAGLLTQALRREGTHPTGSTVGVLISPSLVPYRRSQGLHERHRSTTDPLAHRVTMRHSALLVTADELDIATREAAVGTLD